MILSIECLARKLRAQLPTVFVTLCLEGFEWAARHLSCLLTPSRVCIDAESGETGILDERQRLVRASGEDLERKRANRRVAGAPKRA